MGARPHANVVIHLPSFSAPSPGGTIAKITVDLRVFWPHPAAEADVMAALDVAMRDVKNQVVAWYSSVEREPTMAPAEPIWDGHAYRKGCGCPYCATSATSA